MCDLCHHHIPALEPWKAWKAGKWSILIWTFGFPLQIHSEIDEFFHRGEFPKASSRNGIMQCGVEEPWSRTGKFGVIFPECQEDAATTGMLQAQKPSLAGNPFHKAQKSKRPLKRQSVLKRKKGMQTTEVLENVKCRKLGDERKTLEWQINDKLLILLLLLLLFSCQPREILGRRSRLNPVLTRQT